MQVKDILNRISFFKKNDSLTNLSKVTVHMLINDGEAVEWSGDDIQIEYHGSADGLEINVNMPEWLKHPGLQSTLKDL